MTKSLTYLLLIFALFISGGANAQLVVTNLKENLLYYGVENPIDFALKNYDTSQVTLEVNKGNLEKSGYGDWVAWHMCDGPEHNNVTFYARLKKNKKIVDSVKFRVIHPPDPIIEIATREHDHLDIFFPYTIFGFNAALHDFVYDVRYVVKKFTVSFYLNKRKLYDMANESAIVSDEVRLRALRLEDYARSLDKKDTVWVVFHDFKIKCSCEDSLRKMSTQYRMRLNTDTAIKPNTETRY